MRLTAGVRIKSNLYYTVESVTRKERFTQDPPAALMFPKDGMFCDKIIDTKGSPETAPFVFV